MFRFKVLTRALPRSFKSTLSPCRTSYRMQTMPSILRQHRPSQILTPRSAALFTTSRAVFDSESQVNAELAAKLESELSLEREMSDSEVLPDHIKEFLDNTPFKLDDVTGQGEVVLTRTFGDEKIRVAFSVDDLNNMDEDPDQLNETSLEDEFDEGAADLPSDTQSGGATSKGAINQRRGADGNFKVAPEDSVSESDISELGEEVSHSHDDSQASFSAHLVVSVERAGKGALQIEAVAQDGLIVIDNVYYYKDAKHLEPKTSSDEQAASTLYTGPPFANLDEDLQVLFENYLNERGINTTMALFVPEYIDYKEQKEYLNWLESVKTFVE